MTQRVAFITGGMGGIGTAIAKRLAADGAIVVAGCLPGYERKDEWVDGMRGQGYKVYAAEGNVEDYDSCADMMYRVRSAVGPVDILVNGAGITRDGLFKRMSPTDWYAVINTNLNSVFNVTRQVIEGMMERGWGRIVNISSVNALKGQFGQTNYSAQVRGAGADRGADPHGPARQARGDRRPDRLPLLRGGRLRDRREHLHQRRPAHGVRAARPPQGGAGDGARSAAIASSSMRR